MEELIAQLGLLFFMLLVLATAVETIVESLRGILELFNITWTKSKMALDDALKLAAEFAPDNKALGPKLMALQAAARQIGGKVGNKITALGALKDKLDAATDGETAALANQVRAAAMSASTELANSDARRVFLLRLISAAIGCTLAWWSDFHVFAILAQTPGAEYLQELKGLQSPLPNIIVGGFAAAAGSGYWHDQLDKARNLKTVAAQMKTLTS